MPETKDIVTRLRTWPQNNPCYLMENITIRCFFCNTVLEQKHIDIDPLTGVTTIKVGECKPCMDEAFEDGIDGAYELDDED